MRFLAAALVWLLTVVAAQALVLGQGDLPLRFEPSSPLRLEDSDQIQIEGTVEAERSVLVVLRLDDNLSKDYASRINLERVIPTGPFSLAIGVAGLRTPDGRFFNYKDIRRILLFVWDGDGMVKINRFEVARSSSLPAGAKGYSLGAADAPVPAGFERIAPGDPRLVGRSIRAVRRPMPDPLVANSLMGVERVTLPHEPGRARVTVWVEDPGEWELLPHPLRRVVRVNGQTVISVNLTAERWIKTRYLRGRTIEHTPDDDAWSAYGRWRGDMTSAEVDVGKDGIVIELEGDDPSGLVLSAVLVEPDGRGTGLEYVQAMRAEWYRSNFPVFRAAAQERESAVPVHLASSLEGAAAVRPIKASAAPDTGIRVRLEVSSDTPISSPKVAIKEPQRGSRRLPVYVWAAERRLERYSSELRLGNDFLLADTGAVRIGSTDARYYEIWTSVPGDAEPGSYAGEVRIGWDGGSRVVPLQIEVLPVELPRPRKPAGFYLAKAWHLTWFPGLKGESDKQAWCDLRLMKEFGLTGTAPPIAAPMPNDEKAFLAGMNRALLNGVEPGWLIYGPTQQLLDSLGSRLSADVLAAASKMSDNAGFPAPQWSVADEPSNPAQKSGHIPEWVGLLRSRAPRMQLAGHLNSAADERLTELFDTVIINPGYGIDASRISMLKAKGRRVWLYNTFLPRLTAGAWLWRTEAEHYVQWHARMPTADPFDPTDGREEDAQVIYPTSQICPPKPDVHADLLRMAEGVVDQRWLQWLQAQTTPEARRLALEVRARIGDRWEKAKKLSGADLDAIRGSIMSLVPRGR